MSSISPLCVCVKAIVFSHIHERRNLNKQDGPLWCQAPIHLLPAAWSRQGGQPGGVILGSSWGHPGVILGSSWSHLGVPSEGLKSPGALEKLSGGGWWVVGGGTVIITSAPGPGLCHSQRFSEILWDMVWYGMVWYGMVWYGMDLDRSLTINSKCWWTLKHFISGLNFFSCLVDPWY